MIIIQCILKISQRSRTNLLIFVNVSCLLSSYCDAANLVASSLDSIKYAKTTFHGGQNMGLKPVTLISNS